MRIGFCASLKEERPEAMGERMLQTFKALSVDYLELSLSEIAELDEAAYEALASALKASGLKGEACNGFFPASLRLTGAKVDRGAIAAYTEAALKRAAGLGLKVAVFGSGGAREIPTGFPKEEGFQQLAFMLREIAAPIAARNDMVIAIEPLRSQECNIINTYTEGCQLAQEVNHEAVGVLVDYYHLCQEEEPLQNIEKGARWLRHVHFARNEGRSYPKNAEEEQYRAFAATLRNAGYRDRVSLEAGYDNFAAEAPIAAEVMRELFS